MNKLWMVLCLWITSNTFAMTSDIYAQFYGKKEYIIDALRTVEGDIIKYEKTFAFLVSGSQLFCDPLYSEKDNTFRTYREGTKTIFEFIKKQERPLRIEYSDKHIKDIQQQADKFNDFYTVANDVFNMCSQDEDEQLSTRVMLLQNYHSFMQIIMQDIPEEQAQK